jgi:hypothetical protein
MKRPGSLPILFLTGLVLLGLRLAPAGGREVILFDGPRGGWLASVRADAVWEVVEERDGWQRVRLEGWIPGPAGATPSPGPPAAAPAADGSAGGEASAAGWGSAAVAAPPPGGATITGVLLPTGDDRAAGPGAGLVVLLVGDLDALDAEHARAGGECRARLEASEAEIGRKRDDYRRGFNSSDNFREAARRNDTARRALEDAERAHRGAIDDCRRSADEVMHRHAVRRMISDPAGRFEFTGVPPGAYRVIAAEIGGAAPRAWALDCPVRDAATIALDPRTDRSAMEPYWGIDRRDDSGDRGSPITSGA